MDSHASQLLPLLHLCDSLFPLGAFAHSDGLESATAAGLVSSGAELRMWLHVTRDEVLAHGDGPGLRIAYAAFQAGDLAAVAAVDEELHAMRPALATRQAGRAMGGRLVRTWQALRPHSRMARLLATPRTAALTLPVAFGIVCAASGVPLTSALEGFFYTRLAATISAAMRLMSIGQHEAHALLAEVLDGVPAAVAVAIQCPEPASFVPALDLAAMSHQYVHSRLFRS